MPLSRFMGMADDKMINECEPSQYVVVRMRWLDSGRSNVALPVSSGAGRPRLFGLRRSNDENEAV